MATKRRKTSRGKTARTTAKPKPTGGAGGKDRRRAPDRRTGERRATPGRPGTTELPLGERAERLRAAIEQSKLTAPDPWTYTPKARRWGQRAEQLVYRIRGGESPVLGRELEALTAEVEGDRDFQDARGRF